MTKSHVFAACFLVVLGTSCTNQSSKSQEESSASVVVEEDIWLIEEHQYDEVAITSAADAAPADSYDGNSGATEGYSEETSESEEAAADAEEAEEADELEAEMMAEEAYEIMTLEAMEEDLIEAEYEAMASTIVETDIMIPLDETQTVVAYNKKGDPKSAFQVTTNLQTGEIEHITFMDKKHQDEYDVQAGMSGKEVKRLRKELKHMVKKGQVFLYDDQSNIMYLMDAQNMVGDEITVADIESMEVTAIVWKDKKHHKKNKKEST